MRKYGARLSGGSALDETSVSKYGFVRDGHDKPRCTEQLGVERATTAEGKLHARGHMGNTSTGNRASPLKEHTKVLDIIRWLEKHAPMPNSTDHHNMLPLHPSANTHNKLYTQAT